MKKSQSLLVSSIVHLFSIILFFIVLFTLLTSYFNVKSFINEYDPQVSSLMVQRRVLSSADSFAHESRAILDDNGIVIYGSRIFPGVLDYDKLTNLYNLNMLRKDRFDLPSNIHNGIGNPFAGSGIVAKYDLKVIYKDGSEIKEVYPNENMTTLVSRINKRIHLCSFYWGSDDSPYYCVDRNGVKCLNTKEDNKFSKCTCNNGAWTESVRQFGGWMGSVLGGGEMSDAARRLSWGCLVYANPGLAAVMQPGNPVGCTAGTAEYIGGLTTSAIGGGIWLITGGPFGSCYALGGDCVVPQDQPAGSLYSGLCEITKKSETTYFPLLDVDDKYSFADTVDVYTDKGTTVKWFKQSDFTCDNNQEKYTYILPIFLYKDNQKYPGIMIYTFCMYKGKHYVGLTTEEAKVRFQL